MRKNRPIFVGSRRRRNKYGVAPANERRIDGILFASKREMRKYLELKRWRSESPLDRFFLRQVPFGLPGGIKYVADFVTFDGGPTYDEGPIAYRVKVIDVKGVRTPVYKLKKAQVEQIYPIKITEE